MAGGGVIFSLREGLRSALSNAGFPVEVRLGPEYAPPMGALRRHVIVLDRDRETGDVAGAPVGVQRNPSRIMVRMIGYTVTVYACEPKAGAFAWEHDAEADRIVDGVLVAMYDWASAQRAKVEIVSGRFLTPDEYLGSDTSPVSCYRLQCRVSRSVDRKDYDGSAHATADLGGIETTALTDLAGAD